MAAAVSQDDARTRISSSVARKCEVVTRFRNTIGLMGRLAVRLQPNHPTDDPRGIAASIIDGLLLRLRRRGHRHQPGHRQPGRAHRAAADARRAAHQRFDIPTQSCVLGHMTTTMRSDRTGAPVDLVFQSIAGTRGRRTAASASISSLLAEAHDAGAVAARAARSATT